MPPLSPFDQITERVELLLAHHAEMQRSNALLAQQVAALSIERDSLKSRLQAARNRIEALVERLEATPAAPPESAAAAPATDPAPALATAPEPQAGPAPLPPKEEHP